MFGTCSERTAPAGRGETPGQIIDGDGPRRPAGRRAGTPEIHGGEVGTESQGAAGRGGDGVSGSGRERSEVGMES